VFQLHPSRINNSLKGCSIGYLDEKQGDMTWTKLESRFNDLPLVLAGPIVRRVDRLSATIWIALKEPRKVTARLYASDSAGIGIDQQQIGTRSTYAIGANLHVVAVTTSGAPLAWGQMYRYDLSFGQHGDDQVPVHESSTRLFDATVLAPDTVSGKKMLLYDSSEVPLTVPPPTLPSFVLPPNDLSNLRLIHASCRKPHGEAKDALQILDELIRITVSAPLSRPHQLFLTGDQIYADDVADALLMMLTDAGDTLLGWAPPESLPGLQSGERAANLPPGKRGSLVTDKMKAGLSSSEGKSHLFSAGEFYAMYLFAWSSTLWTLRPPDFADVYPVESTEYAADISSGVPETKRRFRKLKQEFDNEISNLGEYKVALPAVRRTLANIPVYMIFDDHEITDDWYIHRQWCVDALTSELGRRVIQNGLLAYAIFQAWGNTPQQFAAEGSGGARGRRLLEAAERWNGTASSSALAEIKKAVGVEPASNVDQHKKLQHTADTLDWHYNFPFTNGGPQYEVIVLDSRTQRGFPNGPKDPPALISDAAALETQMPTTPAPGEDGVTIVIAPAPVIGFKLVEDLQKTAPTSLAAKLDREAWGLVPKALETLLSKLFTRSSRVLVLSGDVHYGFCSTCELLGLETLWHACTYPVGPASRRASAADVERAEE
jgi:hypothetical protein